MNLQMHAHSTLDFILDEIPQPIPLSPLIDDFFGLDVKDLLPNFDSFHDYENDFKIPNNDRQGLQKTYIDQIQMICYQKQYGKVGSKSKQYEKINLSRSNIFTEWQTDINSNKNLHFTSIDYKNINNTDFVNVMRECRIKGKYRKNTNVPKMLTRIYLKHYIRYLSPHQTQIYVTHYQSSKNLLKQHKTNNFRINDVLQLLRVDQTQSSCDNLKNRSILASIIRDTLREEIISNNFVKGNKMTYMLALRIFGLRCRSNRLIERVKIL